MFQMTAACSERADAHQNCDRERREDQDQQEDLRSQLTRSIPQEPVSRRVRFGRRWRPPQSIQGVPSRKQDQNRDDDEGNNLERHAASQFK